MPHSATIVPRAPGHRSATALIRSAIPDRDPSAAPFNNHERNNSTSAAKCRAVVIDQSGVCATTYGRPKREGIRKRPRGTRGPAGRQDSSRPHAAAHARLRPGAIKKTCCAARYIALGPLAPIAADARAACSKTISSSITQRPSCQPSGGTPVQLPMITSYDLSRQTIEPVLANVTNRRPSRWDLAADTAVALGDQAPRDHTAHDLRREVVGRTRDAKGETLHRQGRSGRERTPSLPQ